MHSLIPFTIAMGHQIAGYPLVFAIVGACAVVFILQAIKTVKDRRDSNLIYEFLCRCAKDEPYTFRSSETISRVTNLPVSRISDLCSKHHHIVRKAGQLHTWRVADHTSPVISVYDEAGSAIEAH